MPSYLHLVDVLSSYRRRSNSGKEQAIDCVESALTAADRETETRFRKAVVSTLGIC
jgi:hypothetical protein